METQLVLYCVLESTVFFDECLRSPLKVVVLKVALCFVLNFVDLIIIICATLMKISILHILFMQH
jgi:hypothetical protein